MPIPKQTAIKTASAKLVCHQCGCRFMDECMLEEGGDSCDMCMKDGGQEHKSANEMNDESTYYYFLIY